MSKNSREVLVQLSEMLNIAKNTDRSIGMVVESGNFYLEGETNVINVIDDEESIRIEGTYFTLSIDKLEIELAEYDDIDDAFSITYSDKSIYIV